MNVARPRGTNQNSKTTFECCVEELVSEQWRNALEHYTDFATDYASAVTKERNASCRLMVMNLKLPRSIDDIEWWAGRNVGAFKIAELADYQDALKAQKLLAPIVASAQAELIGLASRWPALCR